MNQTARHSIIPKIITTFSLLLGMFVSHAYGGSITVNPESSNIALGEYLHYLEDPSSSLTVEDFLKEDKQNQLTKSEKRTSSFGYTQSSYWFQLTLNNEENIEQDIILEFDYPVLDSIDLYWVDQGETLSHTKMGDLLPFFDRTLDHRNFLIPTSLKANSQANLVFRIKTSSSFKVGLMMHQPTAFWQKDAKETTVQGLYFGIMLVMIIYNAFVYLSLRSASYLYYVLYVGNLMIFQLSLLGYDYQYLWPNSPALHERSILFCIGGTLFSLAFFTHYFLDLKQHTPKLDKVICVIAIGTMAMGFLSIVMEYAIAVRILNLLALVQLLLILTAGLRRLLQKSMEARYFMLAFSSLLLGAVLIGLRFAGVLPSIFLTDYGLQIGAAFEVILLSLALARRIKRLQDIAAEEAERVKKLQRDLITSQEEAITTLDAKVKERTIDLEEKNRNISSMLENLPQGILTITSDMTIHHEYSKFLESIFEQQNLVGKNAIDFLFEGSNLSMDLLSQVRSSVFSSMGEDDINYTINEDILPQEITRTFNGDRKKFLDFSWSPIINNQGQVEKILVSVRDITTLKELEAAAQEQKERMQLISNLLSIPKKDFEHFANSTKHYLEENKKIIMQAAGNFTSKIDELFRNMHTIKGNARGLHLTELSAAAHISEHRYAQIRLGKQDYLNPEETLNELEEVNRHFEMVKDINDNTLNRSKNNHKDELTSKLLRDIENGLSDLRSTGKDSSEKIIDNILERINEASKSTMTDIMNSMKNSITEIAAKLEKNPPTVQVTGDNIYFTDDQEILLKDVLTHLTRNSLDHGIESPDRRKQSDKSEQGHIKVNTIEEEQYFTIQFSDDGHGINLNEIYEKGIQNNMLSPDKKDNTDAVVSCIFKPGFSTAKNVSDISGRGVGMDAAKKFLAENGASIELIFINNEIDHSINQPFYLEIKIPKQIEELREIA